MPKRTDLKSILIIGAGPIIIGQACEFDYSGVQACKALKEEGYRVILVNSNPATIMTDPQMADVTYIEPINWTVIKKIIEKEKPSALLPTMGGQTALNCALDLVQQGVLAENNVELIGASRQAIDKAEDRLLFQKAMQKIGLETPTSGLAHNLKEAEQILDSVGFPCIIRPSFTLGGTGGGIAYNRNEFQEICSKGLMASPTHELLIEESVLGWKEFELEVIRDRNDNCIIVCGIENIDPMGVHTGDSITVAPIQTLTDKEYQTMRDAAIAVLREIGVETGGANVQFAVNPENGRMIVVEMNPRVSRSSALASKATGFPIAKVAAKLAIGYTLDELRNEITDNRIPASFEPTLDYVVIKIPRFNFEKFHHTEDRLTTQMKSVGEVMAVAGNFQEALQKAIRGLEIDRFGFEQKLTAFDDRTNDKLRKELSTPSSERLWYIGDAFRFGLSLEEVYQHTKIDPWFLYQIQEIIELEKKLSHQKYHELTKDDIFWLKRKGFADARLAQLFNITEEEFRAYRHKHNILPVYKRIDTCAAEFPTTTAYLYSTYQSEDESKPSTHKKMVVLGSGPNRIGQGIEFDYCCVHAAGAMRELGYETIMVNCNPETVSTDFDTSDRLYFEPLTLEDVLEILYKEKPKGVIVQFGGQTPLKLAQALKKAGLPIIGTSPDAIDRCEDREQFQQLVQKLNLTQPSNGTIRSFEEGVRLSKILAYPLIVRPSFVLGGRSMTVVHHPQGLVRYMKSGVSISPKAPLLLDQFLDDAVEVDVDAICDGDNVLVGVLEHIEQAGIHSGDSTCVFPPHQLSQLIQKQLKTQVTAIAKELNVVGLINAQFAIKDDKIYVLEVNPRASRTVPFIAKASGLSFAKIAAKCMASESLAKQNIHSLPSNLDYYAVKKAIFPFDRFPGADPLLSPEMRSTGEVMGLGKSFGEAFAKALLASNELLPKNGTVFISIRDSDKKHISRIAKCFHHLGWKIVATKGTAKALQHINIPCDVVKKVSEGRPNIVDMIKNDEIDFIINTTAGRQAYKDSYPIRQNAVQHRVPSSTTLTGGIAVCESLSFNASESVISLQELYKTKSLNAR
jgi:carbamoyl-phosphate synthase large subunit